MVAPLGRPLEELLAERDHGVLGLADDHEARRVLVEAVDQTGPGSGLAFGGRKLLEVVQQAIDQRAGKVAESGMDH